MTLRLIELAACYFEWPVGHSRPTMFAIPSEALPGYLARNNTTRIANAAESRAALAANQAGPANRVLEELELLDCYRSLACYEQFHLAEGVPPACPPRAWPSEGAQCGAPPCPRVLELFTRGKHEHGRGNEDGLGHGP